MASEITAHLVLNFPIGFESPPPFFLIMLNYNFAKNTLFWVGIHFGTIKNGEEKDKDALL